MSSFAIPPLGAAGYRVVFTVDDVADKSFLVLATVLSASRAVVSVHGLRDDRLVGREIGFWVDPTRALRVFVGNGHADLMLVESRPGTNEPTRPHN